MPLRVTAEPDPLEKFLTRNTARGRDLLRVKDRAGEVYSGDDDDVFHLVYHDIRDEWCMEATTATYGGRLVCTRPKGHPKWWNHVAASGRYVMRIWGAEPVPNLDELVDPEDGSPVDQTDVLTKDALKLGYCYKLRDRENKLYVLGGVDEYIRTDGLIEVLDLKKREFRTLPVEELVPSDYVMTPQELSLVVAYIARVRKTVKNEAVAMYRRDKWCRDGLNAALKDLGLAPYKPELTGEAVIRIPWSAPEGTLNSHVKDKLITALRTIDLSVLNVEVNPDDYLAVEPDQAQVDIENLRRR